jgi:FkbM family methyltransferase
MFNNCNSDTNGEKNFYLHIKDKINVIFDIGCRSDTVFTDFQGEVHYFDPVPEFIDKLKASPSSNKIAHFNTFGLGNDNAEISYYPKYQSFYDRVASCKVSDDANKIILKIRKGSDYVKEHNIQSIDFMKIDTEGYELNVLKGFEEHIKNVKVIQFEYGGTFLDNGLKLIDVINYLSEKGFHKFSYITPTGLYRITDFNDHYQYCNIVCVNVNSDII